MAACAERRVRGTLLVEMAIVTAIIAILAGLGVVSWGASRHLARAAACRANQRAIQQAIVEWQTLHGSGAFVTPDDGFGSGEVVLLHDGSVVGDPARRLTLRAGGLHCPEAGRDATFSYVTDGQVVRCLHDGAVGLRGDGAPFAVDVAVPDRVAHAELSEIVRTEAATDTPAPDPGTGTDAGGPVDEGGGTGTAPEDPADGGSDPGAWTPAVVLSGFGKSLAEFATVGAQSGRWRVSHGVVSQNGRAYGLLATEQEFSDFTYALSMRTDVPGNSYGWETGRMVFRVEDEDNYYAVLLRADGTLELAANRGGVWQPSLAIAGTRAEVENWQDLVVTARGARIQVQLGGVQLIDWTDPDPILRGAIGVANDHTKAEYRGLVVSQ